MTVLQVRDLRKDFDGNPILKGLSLSLSEGDRVGLVGPNGCGKTTLLRILAGLSEADGGSVAWLQPRLSRSYLSQNDHWHPQRSLGSQLQGVPADLLSRCGITREIQDRPAGSLSGGQKVRAALARTLAGSPQVLLLDEPTNHLDADGLTWLEGLLAGYPGTVLLVSHDRYFLDQVVTRILELEDGTIREYPGNYSAYALQKAARHERAEAEYAKYRTEKKRLEESIRRQRQWAEKAQTMKPPRELVTAKAGWKAGSKAMMQQVKSKEKQLARIAVEKPFEKTRVSLRLHAEKTARNLVLAEDLGFTYDGSRWLFRRSGFFIQRGDKLALVGPNGAGKSTLLRLMLGSLAPSEGSLRVAPVRVAYLAQEMENLSPEKTVLEEATGNAAPDQARARALLGCLLFQREEVFKRVRMLSGGEKVRLALAKILLQAPDLLVLDEPTNGLDLLARERVDEALEDYPGTMILVSHDRYLLQRVATRVLDLAGGRVAAFPGTYEEFLQQRGARDYQAATDGPPGHQTYERRLLIETRLAEISASLATAPPEKAELLQAEFIQLSRELRALQSQ